jgi:hypothetical protein
MLGEVTVENENSHEMCIRLLREEEGNVWEKQLARGEYAVWNGQSPNPWPKGKVGTIYPRETGGLWRWDISLKHEDVPVVKEWLELANLRPNKGGDYYVSVNLSADDVRKHEALLRKILGMALDNSGGRIGTGQVQKNTGTVMPPQKVASGPATSESNVQPVQVDSAVQPPGAEIDELEQVRKAKEDEGAFDPSNLEDARKRCLAAIVIRQGQSAFREKLLVAYHRRCPVTGCDVPAALEAAHIVPYCGPETNNVTNGLLLRGDIHTLFDLGLMALDPSSHRVLISKRLEGSHYASLDGKVITPSLPENRAEHPSQEALKSRLADFKAKEGS